MAGIDNSMTISLFSPVLRQLKIKNIGGFSHIVSFTGWFYISFLFFSILKNRYPFEIKKTKKVDGSIYSVI